MEMRGDGGDRVGKRGMVRMGGGRGGGGGEGEQGIRDKNADLGLV